MLMFLLACVSEELPEEVIEPDVPEDQAAGLRYTQEQLSTDPSAITISGELYCEAGSGPWTVRLWSLRRADRERAPDALPAGEVFTEITLDAPGPFTVYSARSARLMVVGVSADSPPLLAWGDPYGRYTEAVDDRSSFNLDCRITPTRSPDGTLMSSQGEVVQAEPEPVAEDADPQMDRIVAIKAAPRVDVFRRKPTDFGGSETVERIEARYRSQLSEEEMRVHMLMLYQLTDDPKAADEYVRGVVTERGASTGKSNSGGTVVIQ
ncbi:MAG: hypothetical protein ACI8RZ_000726 [Myxococcota bacterium]|jgi:hypothetical protein